jgi:hypothetical protein
MLFIAGFHLASVAIVLAIVAWPAGADPLDCPSLAASPARDPGTR